MKKADYELVLDVMHKHREEGVSLMALARETGQRLPDLQKFMRAHRKCFVMVDATKFKLNPAPPINGNVGSVRFRLRSEESKKRQQNIGMWVAITVAITSVFYAIINMF